MWPEDKVRLQHILDEANEACKYAKDISFDEFLKDGKTARAIKRSAEVVGEAASKMSDELQKELPALLAQGNSHIYAYDAYVIGCALKHNAALLSLDEGLLKAAKEAGVKIREVKI